MTPYVAKPAFSADQVARLDRDSRQIATQYRATTPHLSARDEATLNAWYASEQGQQALQAVFWHIWDAGWRMSCCAMPAHDARHALWKVPARALEHIAAEPINGIHRLGVLAALLHDVGRWVEEEAYGIPIKGSFHSRMSFMAAREILAGSNIPELARHLILRGVLQHTKGASVEDEFATQVVVTADRDQLNGPEIVLRMVHHVPTAALCLFIDEPRKPSVVEHLTRLYCVRLPGPLFALDANTHRLREMQGQFIRQVAPLEDTLVRFHANGLTEAEAYRLYESPKTISHGGLQCEISMFLDAHHVAPAPEFKALATARLEEAVGPNLTSDDLAAALAQSRQDRCVDDARQLAALATLATEWESSDPWLCVVARALISKWNEAAG